MRMWLRQLLLISIFGLHACAPAIAPAAADQVTVDRVVGGLSSGWVSAWNRDDAGAIERVFGEDAVLLFGPELALRGPRTIQERFVTRNLPVVRDMAVTPLKRGVSAGLAYETGSYTLRVEQPNRTPYTQTGRYTFVWGRQADGSWKVESLIIDADPAPTG